MILTEEFDVHLSLKNLFAIVCHNSVQTGLVYFNFVYVVLLLLCCFISEVMSGRSVTPNHTFPG